MPEFTYEESDNYICAQMAAGYSDGELKKEYFDCLRGIKQGGMNNTTHLWLDILTTQLEQRGLMENGRVINKKKSE
jgi:hypothetical protein